MGASEGLGELMGKVPGLCVAIVVLGVSVTLMLRLLHLSQLTFLFTILGPIQFALGLVPRDGARCEKQ